MRIMLRLTWYSPGRHPGGQLQGVQHLCQPRRPLCSSPYKTHVNNSEEGMLVLFKMFHWLITWKWNGSNSRCPSRRRAQRLQQCNQLGRLEKNWWQKCMFFCTFGTFKVIFVLTSKGPLPETKCFLSGIAQITSLFVYLGLTHQHIAWICLFRCLPLCLFVNWCMCNPPIYCLAVTRMEAVSRMMKVAWHKENCTNIRNIA